MQDAELNAQVEDVDFSSEDGSTRSTATPLSNVPSTASVDNDVEITDVNAIASASTSGGVGGLVPYDDDELSSDNNS
jgi:hypothetical protein